MIDLTQPTEFLLAEFAARIEALESKVFGAPTAPPPPIDQAAVQAALLAQAQAEANAPQILPAEAATDVTTEAPAATEPGATT